MPLNMTKIAFGAESPQHLRERLAAYAQDGEVRLTTRYLPKRVAEMAGGSLYWIHTHTIIGRSPIIGFMENGAGRHWIRIQPQLIAVRSTPQARASGLALSRRSPTPRPISTQSKPTAATKCRRRC